MGTSIEKGRDPYKILAKAIESEADTGTDSKYRKPWRVKRLIESVKQYGSYLHSNTKEGSRGVPMDESLAEPKEHELGQSLYYLAMEYISKEKGARNDKVHLLSYGTAWAMACKLGIRNSTIKTIASRKVKSQSELSRLVSTQSATHEYVQDCLGYSDKIWAQLMEWYKIRPWLYTKDIKDK